MRGTFLIEIAQMIVGRREDEINLPQLIYMGLPHLQCTISSVVASPKSERNT